MLIRTRGILAEASVLQARISRDRIALSSLFSLCFPRTISDPVPCPYLPFPRDSMPEQRDLGQDTSWTAKSAAAVVTARPRLDQPRVPPAGSLVGTTFPSSDLYFFERGTPARISQWHKLAPSDSAYSTGRGLSCAKGGLCTHTCDRTRDNRRQLGTTPCRASAAITTPRRSGVVLYLSFRRTQNPPGATPCEFDSRLGHFTQSQDVRLSLSV